MDFFQNRKGAAENQEDQVTYYYIDQYILKETKARQENVAMA